MFVEDNPRFSATSDPTESEDEDSETEGGPPPMDFDLPDEEPPRPAWMTVYTRGNEADADVVPNGPGVLLVGGGTVGDAPYIWQAGLIAMGDIVVLQGKEPDLLTNYLYDAIGGADSVQTLVVPPGASAFDPWVAWTIAHAEAVLIVGDNAYEVLWKDTPIEGGIMAAWERGAVIGGVEAGLSSLGEFVYPGYGDGLTSGEALADPYSPNVALERNYLALDLLENTLIEPRFVQDNRMGRLLVFAARVLQDDWSNKFVGLGISDDTALVIGPDGLGEVMGTGYVYVFETHQRADTCAPGQVLEFGPVLVARLAAGDTVEWPGGDTSVVTSQVIATGGAIEPSDPYGVP